MCVKKMKTRAVLAFALVVFAAGGLDAKAFDHGRWEKLLKTYVTEDGWVDYRGIRSKGAGELKAYLNELASASGSQLASRQEAIAFWINAYNALCIQKLIDSRLPKKVPNASFFGKNIFKERTYKVAGKIRSLNDIEHGILRKKYTDNRVHAALVCGASSCPRLRSQAYTAEKLDEQLTEECVRWVRVGKTKTGERKIYLDRRKKVFYVSKIFDWFEEDFGDSDAGVLRFLTRFCSDSDREFLKNNRVKVRYLTYDWRLNSVSGK